MPATSMAELMAASRPGMMWYILLQGGRKEGFMHWSGKMQSAILIWGVCGFNWRCAPIISSADYIEDQKLPKSHLPVLHHRFHPPCVVDISGTHEVKVAREAVTMPVLQ